MEDAAFSGLSTDGAAAEEEEGVRTVPWPAGKRGGGGGGGSAETGNVMWGAKWGKSAQLLVPADSKPHPNEWQMKKGVG